MIDTDGRSDPAQQLRPNTVDPISIILGDHAHVLARTVRFHFRAIVPRRPGRNINAYHRSPVLEPGHAFHVGAREVRPWGDDSRGHRRAGKDGNCKRRACGGCAARLQRGGGEANDWEYSFDGGSVAEKGVYKNDRADQ